MNNAHTLKYERDLVTKAVRSFFLRKLGVGYFIALLLLLGYLIYDLAAGDRSWLVGTMGAVIGFGILVPLAAMIGHIRLGLRKLAEMPDATATMTITDSGLVVRSAIGSSEITWRTITEVWQYPDYWLLLSGRHFLMTLPLIELSEEERRSILAAFQKANIMIV
jgi:YcxB-like protein